MKPTEDPIPYSVAFTTALPHGIVVGIHLPDTKEPVPDEVIARLYKQEIPTAQGFSGYKQVSWVGGRLAASLATKGFGFPRLPVLSGPSGEPIYNGGLCVTISHKRTMAVAMVARSHHGSIGIDLEIPQKPRMGIAERVLTPTELAEVRALPKDRQWTATLMRFSLKEALYKALFPRVRRFVDFSEAEITPNVNGSSNYTLTLKNNEGPFIAEGRIHWFGENLLATAHVRKPRKSRRPRSKAPAPIQEGDR
jgi:4'-phosphopantetheinyl transferase EntD